MNKKFIFGQLKLKEYSKFSNALKANCCEIWNKSNSYLGNV